MRYVGIDPGTTGCLSAILENGAVVFCDVPTYQVKVGKKNRTVYNIPAMLELLMENVGKFPEIYVVLEEVHAMPKTGSQGNFGSGFGYGLWQGLLTALRIPYGTVQPGRWKKLLGLKRPEGDGSDAAKKNADRMFACQLFPQAASRMNLKKSHNRADSLLLAEYGRRTYGGSHGNMEASGPQFELRGEQSWEGSEGDARSPR